MYIICCIIYLIIIVLCDCEGKEVCRDAWAIAYNVSTNMLKELSNDVKKNVGLTSRVLSDR